MRGSFRYVRLEALSGDMSATPTDEADSIVGAERDAWRHSKALSGGVSSTPIDEADSIVGADRGVWGLFRDPPLRQGVADPTPTPSIARWKRMWGFFRSVRPHDDTKDEITLVFLLTSKC